MNEIAFSQRLPLSDQAKFWFHAELYAQTLLSEYHYASRDPRLIQKPTHTTAQVVASEDLRVAEVVADLREALERIRDVTTPNTNGDVGAFDREQEAHRIACDVLARNVCATKPDDPALVRLLRAAAELASENSPPMSPDEVARAVLRATP